MMSCMTTEQQQRISQGTTLGWFACAKPRGLPG